MLWVAVFTVAGPLSAGGAVAQVSVAGDEAADSGRDNYWQEGKRGWFFYEPRPKKPVVSPQPPAPPVAAAPAEPAKPPKHPDLVRFEALQKRVEDSRNIAIINPTEANLREYLAAQHLALETASKFGEASTRVVWATPEIDPTLHGRPTSATGLSLYEAEEGRRNQRKWSELSETHAFFFFFKSDCPYCHRFAPILQQFSARSGIKIMPVSMDGAGLPDFPDFSPDNGIGSRLGVNQVPALFLAEPRTGKVMPVGYGVISPVDLERRLDLITRPEAEQVAPSTVKFVGDLASR